MLRLNISNLQVCSLLAIALTGCVVANGAKGGANTPAAPKPAAVRYSLPKTTLAVEVQVERGNELPGKYCDFLDLFFPELDLVAACQTKKDANPGENLIAKKVKTSIVGYAVTLKGTPDASRVHDVSFDASWHVERTDSMTFTEGGTLTGAEIQRADRTAEIILGILSNAAKIAGRFVFGGGSNLVEKAKESDKPWERIEGLKENWSLIPLERRELYTALWDKDLGKKRLALATRSYGSIVDDLKKLQDVLGGSGGPASPALVAELQKRADGSLADDFLGSKTKDAWTPVYEITPDQPKTGRTSEDYPLFEFSGCGVSKESQRPVKNMLSLLRCSQEGAETATVKFTVKTASGQAAARVPKTAGDAAKGSDPAVLYIIRPEAVVLNVDGDCKASMTLASDPKKDPAPSNQSKAACEFVQQPSLLAQWGLEVPLEKAGKDWAYTVSLYEATGALKSIKLTSKAALDKTTIDAAFGIANTLLDAKDTADKEAKKKADDAAAKADELNVLTRSRQILEEKAKIKKLCQDLGLSNCEY